MTTRSSFFNALHQFVLDCVRIGLSVTILLILVVLSLTKVAHAEEKAQSEMGNAQLLNHPSEMTSGGLLFRGDDIYKSVPVLHTDVNITVSGMIARTKVSNHFAILQTSEKRVFTFFLYRKPLPLITCACT